MKRTLILNSHNLSDYQRCPARFQYTHEFRLEPRERKEVFDKGTVISSMLQAYYNLKAKTQVTPRHIMDIVQTILVPSPFIEQADKDFIEIRFLQYFKKYRDESWIPIISETGFSKTLYEDDNYLFVYEGRPDLIYWLNPERKILGVADHKSQGRRYDYYYYNNQALGYCWATGAKVWSYNYFGLQETGKPDEWFRRTNKVFDQNDIGEWERVTIEWCKKIVTDELFHKSWQCQNGWGVCEYSRICEQKSDFARSDVMKRFYQISTYRSW